MRFCRIQSSTTNHNSFKKSDFMLLKAIQNIILCTFLFLFIFITPVNAEVYKNIDANGRVTYSDKPDSATKVEIKPSINHGPSVTPLIPESAATDSLAAASSVAGLASSVDMMTQFCETNVPSSTRTISQARTKWVSENIKLIEKSILILKDKLSANEFTTIMNKLDNESNVIIEKLGKESISEKQKICNELPAKFSAPQLNLGLQSKLVTTLINYKVSK